MPITDKQRELRRNYLGSSDASAVAGVDDYRTAHDVYMEKVHEVQELPQSDAMQVGNMCEDAVLAWFVKQTGHKIKKNQFRVHDNGIMAANMDAVIVDDTAIVEAKTAGVTSYFDRDQWGEIGTDEIPSRYIIQCQHQMAVMGPRTHLVWVPVLLGGVGFRMYKVHRNDELIESLQKIESKFWTENVLKKIPPPETDPAIETMKRLKRVPNKTVTVDADVVQAWLDAKETLALATKHKEACERALGAALGDAEAAESALGTLTYFEQKRASYAVDTKTFRTLRFKRKAA